MPSIAADAARPTGAATIARVAAESARPSDLERGFRTLTELIGSVALPRSVEDELRALEALRLLHRREPLPEAVARSRDDLLRNVALLEREETLGLLAWIRSARSPWHVLSPARRRRRWRMELLFVLLAKTVAGVFRFKILPVLGELQVFGRETELDRLLAAIPRAARGASARLAEVYLARCADILFADSDWPTARRGTASLDVFAAWPWQRRLVALLAWREAVEQEHHDPGRSVAPSPVIVAGTLEFQMSHERAFRFLTRDGGAAARRTLRGLGYRDRGPERRRWPVRRTVAALVLVAAATAFGAMAFQRAREWDLDNHKTASRVLERTAATH